MFAIYKKEMRSYFTTPLGYIFTAVFLAVSGFAFSMFTLQSQTSDVSGYFQIMIFGYIVILPLLTMRSFAEERRQKTEQILMTAPVSIPAMVFAKFLASYTMFAGCALISCIYYVPLSSFGDTNLPKAFGCLIAALLIGMCFIAVGIFISTLTESQVTAAIGTMGTLLLLVIISAFNNRIDAYVIRSVLSWVSIYGRYSNFTYGIFDIASALYYFSVTAIFLFLSVRAYERRRWA